MLKIQFLDVNIFLSGISTDSVLSPSAGQVQSSPPLTAQRPWPILTILHVSFFTFKVMLSYGTF